MSTPKPPTILVIMGSVRAGRRCPQIAEWVLSLADKSDHLAYEIVDLQEWHLPFDDEPSIPAKGAYTHDHTRAWSTKVASADGFVIVSPQYNWGYPAALKNALDHLYNEWSRKPLVIVTYGGHGAEAVTRATRRIYLIRKSSASSCRLGWLLRCSSIRASESMQRGLGTVSPPT